MGLYKNPPPQEALKFINAVQNFMMFTHKLMFSIPSNMVRRYVDTPALKKFFKAADDVVDIGQGFIDKKMRELKEMAEKDKEPSGDTQGNVYKPFINSSLIIIRIIIIIIKYDIFVRFKTMRRKQNLASVLGIQKENWG